MKVDGEAHEKKECSMGDLASLEQLLWAKAVGKGTPDRRGDCRADTHHAYDSSQPEESVAFGIGTDP